MYQVAYDVNTTPERQQVELRRIPSSDRVDHPELKAAIERYEAARAAELKARREHTELTQTRPSAEWEDERALADWIAGGRQGKDPGGKAVAEHDRKTDEARRQAGAARMLLADAVEAYNQALRDHWDDWDAQLERDRDELLAGMGELLDGWASMWAQLQRVTANRVLGSGVPMDSTFYAASLKVPQVRDGDIVYVADVLAGLREVGRPQPEPDNVVANEPAGHTPPSRQPFAGMGSSSAMLGPRRDREAVQRWAEEDERQARERAA